MGHELKAIEWLFGQLIDSRVTEVKSIKREALPEAFVTGKSRIVLAKRPDVMVQGIDRAGVYGSLLELNSRDLTFTQQELELVLGSTLSATRFAETGGWPLLIGTTQAPGKQMTRFLQSEIVAPLDHADLVRLAIAVAPGRTTRAAMPNVLPDTFPRQYLFY